MYPDCNGKMIIRYISFLMTFVLLLVIIQSVFATLDNTSTTTTLLSVLSEDTEQFYPLIQEDIVIWLDSSTGATSIHIYNISQGQETTLNSTYSLVDNMRPDIHNHYIAWITGNYPDYKMIIYDRIISDVISIVDGNGTIESNPDIGDDIIVWQENRLGIPGVIAKSITTGEEISITSDATGNYQSFNPKTSGKWVIWQSIDSEHFTTDIYVYSLINGNNSLITPNTELTCEQNPAIDGNFIVYQSLNPDTSCSDIYLYNLSTGGTLLLTSDTESTSEEFPAIHNGNVVWIGQDPNDFSYDLYLYQIDSANTWLLARDFNSADPGLPAIYKNRVVWQQPNPDTGYSEVYMMTIGVDYPPMVADFSANPLLGGIPMTVNFTDLSSGDISGWLWNFGDNTTSREQNPLHTYNNPGTFGVTLITNSPYQRAGIFTPDYIYVGSPPIPAFSCDRNEGIAPLTVKFSDQTNVSHEFCFWDFGDGALSKDVNPSHTFVTPGSYTVSLTTGNEFGNSTISMNDCIVVTSGVGNEMILDIPGISCENSSYLQYVTINTNLIQFQLINDTCVVVFPDASNGIGKIFFTFAEGISWIDQYSFRGPVSGVICESPSMFYGDDHNNSSLIYQIIGAEYSQNGTFRTEVWENATPGDYQRFKEIAIHGNVSDPNTDRYSGICGVALTAQFGCENVYSTPSGVLSFAIDSDWIEEFGWRWPVPITTEPAGAFVYVDGNCIGNTPLVLPSNLSAGNHTVTITQKGYRDEIRNVTLEEKRDYIRVIRIAEDGSGEILPVTFLYHDAAKNLDYFRAESPHGFSSFGVVSIGIAGNPIQIIFLALQELLPKLLAGAGGGGGTSSPPPAGGNVPSPTTIATTNGVPTEIPTITNTVSPTSTHTSGVTGVTTTGLGNGATPVLTPVQTNHGEGGPFIPFAVIQSIAIVFGVILVVSVLLLRWQKGGGGS